MYPKNRSRRFINFGLPNIQRTNNNPVKADVKHPKVKVTWQSASGTTIHVIWTSQNKKASMGIRYGRGEYDCGQHDN